MDTSIGLGGGRLVEATGQDCWRGYIIEGALASTLASGPLRYVLLRVLDDSYRFLACLRASNRVAILTSDHFDFIRVLVVIATGLIVDATSILA